MAPQVVDRVGRVADGWFPFMNPGLSGQIQTMQTAAKQAGRDPADIGIEVMVGGDPAKALDQLKSLKDQGVTHAAVVTMNQGLAPSEHIDAIRRFMDVAGSVQD